MKSAMCLEPSIPMTIRLKILSGWPHYAVTMQVTECGQPFRTRNENSAGAKLLLPQRSVLKLVLTIP